MALMQGPHSTVYGYDAEERVLFVKELCISRNFQTRRSFLFFNNM
jgi:hypothetical protein